MDVVNNLVSSTDIRPTSSTVSTPIVKDNCTEDPSTSGTNTVNNLVSSMPIALTSSIDTRKQLQFEDEHIDLPEGIILVEDMLDMTQSEVLSSDDEFSMVCVEETPPSNWQFSPITNASRQQLGPLVQITQFYKYPDYVTGDECVQGKVPSAIRHIYGDGNCYFRAISYILSGVENFHMEVRRAVCDFIEVFDGDLKPFLKKGSGAAYIREKEMRSSGKWATETEILATAKIMK